MKETINEELVIIRKTLKQIKGYVHMIAIQLEAIKEPLIDKFIVETEAGESE